MERVSSGTILLAFIAILCGLLGVYSLRQVLRAKDDQAAPPAQTVVPMASRNLEPGHHVTLGDVALVRMTREQMKSRGVADVFMSDPKQIIGRTLKDNVQRGVTFDTENFYPDGAGPGIAESLGPGQRAVTISIYGENALIGFAGAGQTVDVLFKVGTLDEYNRSNWQRRRGYRTHYAKAVTLIQGVKVLALENSTLRTGDQKPVEKDEAIAVTLAVSPEQAEVLRVVEGHGEISLALRHPDDQTTFETIDARTLEDVLGVRTTGPREMEVYRGRRVERLIFDENGELSERANVRTQSSSSIRTSTGTLIGPAPASSR